MAERLSPHLTSVFYMEVVKIANLKSYLQEEKSISFLFL